MKAKNKQFKCEYYYGDGHPIDGGIWELKETPKTICFEQIKKSFFNPNYTKVKVNKFNKKKLMYKKVNELYWAYFNNGHVIRCWGDGTYTAYPNQCGTPYNLEPIK